MRIGFVTSNANFSQPLIEELSRRNHDVQVYRHTASAEENMYQLGMLRATAERVFVDWVQSPLEVVLGNFTCPVFVRAHRLEMYNDAYIQSLPWDKVHTLFFIAHHVADRFLSKCPTKPQRAEVLPHVGIDGGFWRIGVDTRQWQPPYYILLAGNLVPKKRVYTAIELVKDLPEEFHLDLIGNGGMPGYGNEEYHHNLLDHLEGLEMMDRFRSSGNLPQPDLRTRMQQATFVMSASNEEGCHTTVAEGMACGCVPLVHGWRGADKVYPAEWVWPTPKAFYSLVERWQALSEDERHALPEQMYRWVLPKYDSRAIAEYIADVVTGPADAETVGAWYSTGAQLQHMTEQDGNPRQQDALEAVKALIAAEGEGQHDRQFSVLEIGCGTGYISRELAQYDNVAVIGQDIAEGLLQFAADHNPHGAKFLRADATQAMATGPHDIVTAIDVLEHIPSKHHETVLVRICDQLKPGGLLLLRFPHVRTDHQIVEEQIYPKVLRRQCLKHGLRVERFQPLGEYFEVLVRKGGEAA